ncbi:MAG: hypothetical protein AB8G77_04765 [Rhodothermales bacterium]
MNGTEKPLGSVPNRLDEDVLDVYRLMPSHDNERLLEHIAWMENELDEAHMLQRNTEKELQRINALLQSQKRTLQKPLGQSTSLDKSKPRIKQGL